MTQHGGWHTGWLAGAPQLLDPAQSQDQEGVTGCGLNPSLPRSGPVTFREPLTFSGSQSPLGWGAWSWRPQVQGMWCLWKLQELV